MTLTEHAPEGCTHDAFFYDSDEGLLSGALPFLRAGLDRGETTVLVCSERKSALLTESLGEAPRLLCLSDEQVYRLPARTLSTYQDLLEVSASKDVRVRVLGEIPYLRPGTDRAEWLRYESVLNHLLAPYGTWVVCGHDTREVPADILADSELAHPSLFTADASASNPRYVAPEEFLHRQDCTAPHPLESTPPVLQVEDLRGVDELRTLRDGLRHALPTQGVLSDAVHGFVTAVTEVVTNALRHGRPPVTVRVWGSPHRSVCTVTDRGQGFDEPCTGYLPADGVDPLGGTAGLWVARNLCDRVGFSLDPEGFTVRLTARH